MSEVRSEEGNPGAVAPVVGRSRGFSVVWLVPFVALIVGAGLAWQHFQDKGPTVRIRFEVADGLAAGKTKIKYKAIDIGTVVDVELTEDLQGIVATAELDKEAAPYLNDETLFWAVRPEIGAGGITGLDALVSGVYIGILPGHGEDARSDFVGLAHHPLRAGHPNALSLTLLASELGSIERGAKLYYRSLVAGEVVDYALGPDGDGVEIAVVVDPDYADRIRTNTVFWSGGGVEVSVGAAGLQVHAGSLQSLISGGIRFETPSGLEGSKTRPGDTFALHPSYADATLALERFEGLDVWLETTHAKGIAAGAPLYYHEQQIGHIGEPQLSDDATTTRFRAHVERRFAPLVRRNSVFFNRSGFRLHAGLDGFDFEADTLTSLLAGGIAIATPDQPGAPAERDALYALQPEPRDEWLAWAPRIWVGEGPEREIRHAVSPAAPKPKGLELYLEATQVGSISIGAPVSYRQVEIGSVEGHELSADARSVRMRVRIDARYAPLVRTNSRFWNTSGIHAHLGLSGLEVDTGTLTSLMRGGVSLATPDEPGPPVDARTTFPLHAEAEKSWHAWSPAIDLDTGNRHETIHHAIHLDNHQRIFGTSRAKRVESEAIDEAGHVLPAEPSEEQQVEEEMETATARDGAPPNAWDRFVSLFRPSSASR